MVQRETLPRKKKKKSSSFNSFCCQTRPDCRPLQVQDVRLVDPAGADLGGYGSTTDTTLSVYTAEFGDLEPGEYEFELVLSGTLDFADVKASRELQCKVFVKTDNSPVLFPGDFQGEGGGVADRDALLDQLRQRGG